jgi:poly-gamma-glutamate synthesis protein (capsule biosynthesis protein)
VPVRPALTLVAGLAAVAAALAASGCGGTGSATASAPATTTAVRAATVLTTTTPTAAAARTAPRRVNLTIEANGDLLIHSPVWQRAAAYGHGRSYDFRPMLRLIRPYIAGADLALCHVETPMSPRKMTGYPVFNTTPQLARAIKWAGWDACDTASNHSLDGGAYGIYHTGKALDRYGIKHTGSASSAAGARHITMLKAKGVKVAYLAYTQISNGQAQPHWWELNRARAARITADARRARRAGADVVIVNLHWGDEYVTAPSAAQQRLARALAREPAITAVVGQHVHVVQPIRRVGKRIVVFGEGNLLSNQTPGCCAPGSQDGLLALLRIRVVGHRARLQKVDYVPVWDRHPDFTVMPVGLALRRGWSPAGELRSSWHRTVGTVGRTHLYAPWSKAKP